MSAPPFSTYLQSLRAALAEGNATEHTHRPALKTLLESLGEPAAPVVATNEPQRIACGAPDYIVTRRHVPLGHVEAKDLGVDLDRIVRGKAGPESDQFKRYLGGLPNWVLTDYLEFRWFVAGDPEPRRVARLAELNADGLTLRPLPGGEAAVRELLGAFLNQRAPVVTHAAELAQRLAGMARLLRAITLETLRREDPATGFLQTWLRGFREVLVPALLEDDFADMFAQTLAYGLFAARLYTPPGERFSRQLAPYHLPRTNPFLRDFFGQVAGPTLPGSLDWAVDDIAALLDATDPQTVLRDFGVDTARHDPVLHFYEDFLKAYDPAMREARGVYYTPEPVVGYLVRSVDRLLRRDLGRAEGLADRGTLVLDPATGTATFLHAVVAHLHERFTAAGQGGMWPEYVRDHLLTRLFGFELLMAPYTVAHLKLGLQLQHTGFTFGENQRLGVYLTNTLDEAVHSSEQLVAGFIAREANDAAEIKTARPILVVLGNPPYFGRSANPSTKMVKVQAGERYFVEPRLEQGQLVPVQRTAQVTGKMEVPNFIGRLLTDYYVCDGAWLDERNSKWLQDDYVKFIRFAQWRVERTGEGVVAFITNNGYLDNPTFRGMRQNLLRAFDDLYIYDLHGNSRKRERGPEGGLEENVFDIQQGVALLLAVRRRGASGPRSGRVHRADLFGTRAVKYDVLEAEDVSTTAWTTFQPTAPGYLFINQDAVRRTEYEFGWKVTEIFPTNVLGFQTHRDHFAVAFTREELQRRLAEFRDPTRSDEEARSRFQVTDNRDWKVADVRDRLRRDEHWSRFLTRCLYRPFDTRDCYFHKTVMDYPRGELARHVFHHLNLCLLLPRQLSTGSYQHAFCSRIVAESCVVSNRPKEQNYVFPLYLYPPAPGEDELALLDGDVVTNGNRRPNLSPDFLRALAAALDLPTAGPHGLPEGVTPEDIFHYAYAVFLAPAWIARFAEFLRADFPRLPLPPHRAAFRALADAGAELAALHLLEGPAFDVPANGTFPVAGDNVVGEPCHAFDNVTPGRGRVWINATQYFDNVPTTVWETRVGGYLPAQRWLKDRKGRRLTYNDLRHYQKLVTALALSRPKVAALDTLVVPLLAPDTPTERDLKTRRELIDRFISGELSDDIPELAEAAD